MKATFRVPMAERLYKNSKGQKIFSGPWYNRVDRKNAKVHRKFNGIRTVDKRYVKQ